MKSDRSVVVVLSGGLDSATALALARERAKGFDKLIAVNFLYGSLHQTAENMAFRRLCQHYGVCYAYEIPLSYIAKSVLTGSDGLGFEMPEGVPETYVPARNIVFISYAASIALQNECCAVVVGTHSHDASYPDCTDGFINAMSIALHEGTAGQVKLLAPVQNLSKAAVIAEAVRLQVPIETTWTCYTPVAVPKKEHPYWTGLALIDSHDFLACGECDACLQRIAGFKRCGVVDPIEYAIDVDWSGCCFIKKEELLWIHDWLLSST